MPIPPKRLQHRLRHRLPAAPTLATIPMGMTPHTPRIPLLLHKRRLRIKRIAALRAEEMPRVPLRPASDDDLALDRRLAALAPRAEQLVEIQVAVEP